MFRLQISDISKFFTTLHLPTQTCPHQKGIPRLSQPVVNSNVAQSGKPPGPIKPLIIMGPHVNQIFRDILEMSHTYPDFKEGESNEYIHDLI